MNRKINIVIVCSILFGDRWMLFYGHVLMGVLAFLFLEWTGVVSSVHSLLALFYVLLGAILPDIDEKNSKVNRWSGIFGDIIAKLFKHRGFVHSAWFFGAASLIVWHFGRWEYAVSLFVGFLAHIFADCITKMGVKPFAPFQFHIKGGLRVGSSVEKGLWGVMFFMALFFMWKIYL